MASGAQNSATADKPGFSYDANIKPYWEAATRNPAWLLMFVFGRFNWVRALARLRHRILNKPVKQAGASSVFQGIAIEQAVSDLEAQGHTPCFKLNSDRLLDVRQYLDKKTCHAGDGDPIAFLFEDREKVMAAKDQTICHGYYFDDDVADPVIDDIAKDPQILAVARKYFNAEPVHVMTNLFWSFPLEPHQRPTGRRQGTLTFHFDVDDYQAVRMFLYLTDVDEFTGPHVRVPRSHLHKRFWHRVSPFRSRSDEVIAEVYGQDAIDTVTGPGGTGFLEDAFCFHKAALPVTAPRLIMITHYAVRDYRIHEGPQTQNFPLE